MEYAFCDHYGAVGDTENLALDDGGDCKLDYLVEGYAGLVEHLGDDGHRAVGCLAYTQGKVACTAAHCTDEQPVAGGASIFVHGACKMGAFILGGVESEGGGIAGEG